MRVTVRQLKRIINEAMGDAAMGDGAPVVEAMGVDSAGSKLAALYDELSAKYDDEALHVIFSTFASHLDWYGAEAAGGAVDDQLAALPR